MDYDYLPELFGDLDLGEVRPIIKWVGGKTQLLDDILPLIPEKMDLYVEPFIGGASVLIEVLKTKCPAKVIAADLNNDLINLYKHIQKECYILHILITTMSEEYNNIQILKDGCKKVKEKKEVLTKEQYYYYMRQSYNEEKSGTLMKSALFMFLNKTCFRGLHRVGKNGFNVPFGHYKNIEFPSFTQIKNMSTLIRSVDFVCDDYKKIFEMIGKKCAFVYMDPPYVPEKKTSFVGYNLGEFNHVEFFKNVQSLSPNIVFVMSNSDTELVAANFNNIKKISVRRNIHSKDPSVKTDEVIIRR